MLHWGKFQQQLLVDFTKKKRKIFTIKGEKKGKTNARVT
jgi:hypothetical protein